VHCWWEYKVVQLLWKTVWQLLKNVLYDVTIPLLSMYSKELSWAQWHAPTVLATTKANVGKLLEHRSLRPAWATQQDPIVRTQRDIYILTNSSIIHNSQEVKATQESINR
jgi:hypothetical protein